MGRLRCAVGSFQTPADIIPSCYVDEGLHKDEIFFSRLPEHKSSVGHFGGNEEVKRGSICTLQKAEIIVMLNGNV